MMIELYSSAEGCIREYYAQWLNAYRRAHGPYPPPQWEGPALPGRDNTTHDAIAKENRAKRKAKGETWMY